jgi:glycosyltransferase involved in cell wall biosynthesis
MEISFILPTYNEVGNLEKLFYEILNNIRQISSNFEVIFIDDGSDDGSTELIKKLYHAHPSCIKYIIFTKNYGKSAALDAGFKLASGEIVFTLDSDGQDDPKEIPKFIAKINEGYDLVSGWKQNRQDSFIKNSTSKIYNWVTNTIFGLNLHDQNCGFKAYKKAVVKKLSLFSDLHRFIPVLVVNLGYKVTEVKIEHRKRTSGQSKFGIKRFFMGFWDLLVVLSLITFKNKPLTPKNFYQIKYTQS